MGTKVTFMEKEATCYGHRGDMLSAQRLHAKGHRGDMLVVQR